MNKKSFAGSKQNVQVSTFLVNFISELFSFSDASHLCKSYKKFHANDYCSRLKFPFNLVTKFYFKLKHNQSTARVTCRVSLSVDVEASERRKTRRELSLRCDRGTSCSSPIALESHEQSEAVSLPPTRTHLQVAVH